jgi:hypothetical protein
LEGTQGDAAYVENTPAGATSQLSGRTPLL